MRAINVLLSILVSLLIGLLVFEGGLRLLGFAPPKSINRFDPVLGWSKEPGARVRKKSKEYDVVLEIDRHGLRDDEASSRTRPTGTFRVVCLGDSFTLGYTVERRELFVDLLEHRWKAEGRNVDVVNAGTEGYSTDQEAAWLIAHGAAYQPDLVLLFPYENDIYWNGQQQYFRFPKPRFRPDGTLEERELVDPGREPWWSSLALVNLKKTFFPERSTEHVFRPDGGRWGLLKEFGVLLTSPPGFVTEATTRTEGALRALKAKCDELGARLVVAPIPSHSAVDPDYAAVFGEKRLGLDPDAWSADLPVDTFLALSQKLGIETLDARPALRAAAAEGAELYYSVDWHLNAAGNELFADFLAGALAAANPDLLPAATVQLAAGAHIPPPAPAKPLRWPFVFLGLWVLLSLLYTLTYPDEPKWRPPLTVGALLAVIFTIVLGGTALIGLLPPAFSGAILVLFVVAVLGFVAYKLGRRLGTIAELFTAFVMRGHWYLMPLVVVLLTIGSLLLVAASSPLVAPFIYTLF